YQRTAHRITSPWKWRHLKSVIVPSVQSPPSMLKLHDFCNRARFSIHKDVLMNLGNFLIRLPTLVRLRDDLTDEGGLSKNLIKYSARSMYLVVVQGNPDSTFIAQ